MNHVSTADYRRNYERKKVGAEKYLAQHRIRWLFEHITSELVLLTPNEPLDFMIKRVEEITEKNFTDQSNSNDIAIQRPRLLCVLGGPATGKAVLCAFLAEESGMTIVAPSELIRDEIKHGSEVGKHIGELLHRGEVVPTDIITQLVKKQISNPKGTYVLDGYPRTMEQCLALESEVAEISIALYLECSEADMVQRMDERQGGEDDREPLRSDKLNYFYMKTMPVIQYLNAVGKMVTVDASQSKNDSIRQVRNIVHQ